jgi:predicted nucleic acid-binding protein
LTAIYDILKLCDVTPLDIQTYKEAYKIRDRYNVSYWDSLIVASALDNECEILYSEDMQHNLKIEDKLLIRNPLTGAISNEEFPQ